MVLQRVWPFLVWPEVPLRIGMHHPRGRENRLFAIKGNSDGTAVARRFLKHRADFTALADQLADPATALGGEIAELNAAAAEHSHGARVSGVLRFGDQLYRLAWFAERELEASGGAALVGVVGADDGE